MLIQEPTIGYGVGDDQENDVHLPVAELQSQPALNGLGIAKSRLALATRAAPAQNEQAIPCPTISRHGKRDLRSPKRVAGKSLPESLQDRQLTGIARRIAVWKRSK